ncbi:MAG: pyruvate kinase [Patescibacteria group bacterium]
MPFSPARTTHAQTKRTKIVCTIGPACWEQDILLRLGQAGMDVARLNFSHGTHEEHARVFKRLGVVGRKLGKPFGILQDLQGPKIRIGDIAKEGVKLIAGRPAVFTTAPHPAEGDIPVTLPSLHRDVKPKEHLLFDDGLLEVEVKKVDGHRIITEVVQGGTLLPHKGLNLPGTTLHIPALSSKDRSDAIFGAKLGVDFVALSFVRSPNDVKDLRRLLDKQGVSGKAIRIIAKIEKGEAVERFDEILPLCDAIMVARGDLGIETPAANVPVIQKQIIAACRDRAVPVIVATQMLDSMQRNPRPTRAEVSDVANAVADHADAVMLSGETASGLFPIESVRVMADTIRVTEASVFDNLNPVDMTASRGVPEVIGATVRVLVEALRKPAVVIATASGRTARDVSSFRPETSLFAYTFDLHVARTMRLVWGIEPFLASRKSTPELMVKGALHELLTKKKLASGEGVIVVTGSPKGTPGSANRIEIIRA